MLHVNGNQFSWCVQTKVTIPVLPGTDAGRAQPTLFEKDGSRIFEVFRIVAPDKRVEMHCQGYRVRDGANTIPSNVSRQEEP